MKIWELRSDTSEDYQFFTVINESEWSKLDVLSGEKISGNWIPPLLKIGKNNNGKEGYKKSDSPYLSPGVPVFSRKAIDSLDTIIKDSVEILKINFNDYYIINVIDINNYLDESKAVFKYFPNSNRIMRCIKYSFKQSEIISRHIFKTAEFPKGLVLVSDEFRENILASGLEGFQFKEIWDSENG